MHSSPAIDTVVFDLGGVLVRWDPRAAFRGVLPEEEIDPFLTEIDFARWNHALDAGRPVAEAEAEIEERFPHRAGLIAAYRHNFRSTLVGEVPGTAAIVRELADADIRLLALTNWSAESFHHAQAVFPVLSLFEGIVVSGAEKVAKPEPEIFRILIERHAVDPPSTAYVDDVPANVEAALAQGLRAVQFADAHGLRRQLATLGLPLTRRP